MRLNYGATVDCLKGLPEVELPIILLCMLGQIGGLDGQRLGNFAVTLAGSAMANRA